MIAPSQLPEDLRVKTDVDYRFLEQALEALANPTRLKLLTFLTQPHYLEEVASYLKLTRQGVRKHLDRLVAAGILERRAGTRDSGRVTEYVVNPQALFLIHDEFGKLGALRARRPSDTLVRTRVEDRAGGGEPVHGPCLVMVRGPATGQRVPLRPSEASVWALGRDQRSAILVDHDPYASNRHAEVRWEDGRFVLTDLASTNGTTLNWVPLPRGGTLPLRHGDVLGIGKTLLLFTDPPPDR